MKKIGINNGRQLQRRFVATITAVAAVGNWKTTVAVAGGRCAYERSDVVSWRRQTCTADTHTAWVYAGVYDNSFGICFPKCSDRKDTFVACISNFVAVGDAVDDDVTI